jgi:hypothetical protein
MTRRAASLLGVAASLILALPALAHHSTAAFDYTRSMNIVGTVSEFQWTNPHMFIHVMVPDAQGNSAEWNIECGTPNINVRHGWKRSDIKPGDKISMKIHPMRDGSQSGTLMAATLADGRVLYGPGNDIVGTPGAGGTAPGESPALPPAGGAGGGGPQQ